MTEDTELLRRFTEENSATAFRELVQTRIDFVYASALRQVGGDVHLAEEVAQTVFLDLARKARSLADRPNITGWLYTSTRFAAAKALRSRTRRLNHEQEAHVMQEILSASSSEEINWNELRPVLDAVMHELGEKDREAILLRYFESRPLAEVGATLGLAENSARMRVDRALEKLRARLAQRGITSTAVALGAALATQTSVAAPTGLAVSTATLALAGAASSGAAVTLWTFEIMKLTKVTSIAAGAIATLGLGAFLGIQYEGRKPSGMEIKTVAAMGPQSDMAVLQIENRQLQQEIAQLRAVRAGQANRAPATKPADTLSPLDRLRVLADLQQRNLAYFSQIFVERNGRLTRAFTELFDLSTPQRDSLQRAIDSARQRLTALERAHATVSRAKTGEVVIEIDAFPKEGGVVYDELMQAFAQTLGKERNAAYLVLGAEQVERALGRFGAVDFRATVSHQKEAGADSYTVKLEHKLPGELGTSTSGFRSIKDIEESLGSFVQLLPADFSKGK